MISELKEIELEVCGMYYELAIGNKDDCRCDENGPCTGVSEVMDRLKPKIVQAITTSQQAHDSAIAAQARRELMSWLKETCTEHGPFSKEGYGMRLFCPVCRAMAEKEEQDVK